MYCTLRTSHLPLDVGRWPLTASHCALSTAEAEGEVEVEVEALSLNKLKDYYVLCTAYCAMHIVYYLLCTVHCVLYTAY